jgi:YidC/Oxa1 family membrane protein insertase
LILKPDFGTQASVDPIGDHTLEVNLQPKGVAGSYNATIYFGPQELDVLKKYKMGFDRAMVFSDWGWLDALAKVIYTLMHWMHKVVSNWGVCIILISFLIYGSMYPLTVAGMSSMKRMQVIQPKLNQLREQHKNNPQRLNKEIMELYKEYKVNPLGGCLPLLLQMPIFVALYQVLWRSVAFKGADFLWIKDLSQPDRLFMFPMTLPIIGKEFNLLPLLMMIIMFFQQKLSAKNMVITDPAQEAQQKMMAKIFPVFLGVIFYKFASGLSLYFTTFYLMSTLTQWKMSKKKVV